MKFTIDFLPAKYGDCIWIEYGDENKPHRILIDGGTAGTKALIKGRIAALPEDNKHFDLVVITHIDRDHIEGILALLEDTTVEFSVGDIWFNSWQHLVDSEDLESYGAKQGERLTTAILMRKLNWNKAFNGEAVVVDSSNLSPVDVGGNMKLTLLSPLKENLAALIPKWWKEVQDEGLIPGYGAIVPKPEPVDDEFESYGLNKIDINGLNEEDFEEDTAEANGSSIAFLAEYDGRSVLFTGDAFPGVVLNSLNQIYPGKAPVTLAKLSHHGSAGNTSPDLIEKLDCRQWVISTNGVKFPHPAHVTMARVIKRGGDSPELIFNYRSDQNEIWGLGELQKDFLFTTRYPEGEGIQVRL